MSAEKGLPGVGSVWRRNPPGREVVRVERVWDYSDQGMCVRAHPTTGGRPIVCPVGYLREHFTEVVDGATQQLIDTLRKHTGQSEEDAREAVARALDRALGNTSFCGLHDASVLGAICTCPTSPRRTGGDA